LQPIVRGSSIIRGGGQAHLPVPMQPAEMTRAAVGARLARRSGHMRSLIGLVMSSLLIPACAAGVGGDAEDGEHDAVGGKGDSFADTDARLVLSLVNDTAVDTGELDEDAGLSSRVARAIVAHRDGADREPGTADDNVFDDLEELDAIPYLGPVAMRTLLDYAKRTDTGATLTIELVAQEWHDGPDVWGTTKLSELNAELAEYGVRFPDKLTLGARDGRKFLQILRDIELANDKLGREIELDHTWDPSEYVGLCYTGNIRNVPETIERLRESLFSPYMGIQAERWGTTKKFYYSGAGGETEAEWLELQREEHPDVVRVWEDFDTASSAFLMMTDGGQQGDGTEFFAVLIPRC
jgi:hypothetical protein